jgi:hypothetical protein
MIRAMCLGLRGPVENTTRESFEGGFLPYFTLQMRGFLDLLWQKPSSLFVLLERSSISVASLMMRSISVVMPLGEVPSKSGVVEPSFGHHIRLHNTSILSTAPTYMDRSIIKSIIKTK